MRKKSKKIRIEEYMLLHNFEHNNAPIKKWLFDDNDFDAGKYDSDWLWLMPVIQKIKHEMDHMDGEEKYLFDDIKWNSFLRLPIYSDIKEAHLVCVVWIKEYNKFKYNENTTAPSA